MKFNYYFGCMTVPYTPGLYFVSKVKPDILIVKEEVVQFVIKPHFLFFLTTIVFTVSAGGV